MSAGKFVSIYTRAYERHARKRHGQTGREAGAEIPVIEAIADQMTAVVAAHPDEDLAALFRGSGDD